MAHVWVMWVAGKQTAARTTTPAARRGEEGGEEEGDGDDDELDEEDMDHVAIVGCPALSDSGGAWALRRRSEARVARLGLEGAHRRPHQPGDGSHGSRQLLSPSRDARRTCITLALHLHYTQA